MGIPHYHFPCRCLISFPAWTTSGNSDAFGAIKDPNNNVAIRALSFFSLSVFLLTRRG